MPEGSTGRLGGRCVLFLRALPCRSDRVVLCGRPVEGVCVLDVVRPVAVPFAEHQQQCLRVERARADDEAEAARGAHGSRGQVRAQGVFGECSCRNRQVVGTLGGLHGGKDAGSVFVGIARGGAQTLLLGAMVSGRVVPQFADEFEGPGVQPPQSPHRSRSSRPAPRPPTCRPSLSGTRRIAWRERPVSSRGGGRELRWRRSGRVVGFALPGASQFADRPLPVGRAGTASRGSRRCR